MLAKIVRWLQEINQNERDDGKGSPFHSSDTNKSFGMQI
jgi:hypothetical protein